MKEPTQGQPTELIAKLDELTAHINTIWAPRRTPPPAEPPRDTSRQTWLKKWVARVFFNR